MVASCGFFSYLENIESVASLNFEISREYCGEICLVTKGDSSQKKMLSQASGLFPIFVISSSVLSSSIVIPSVSKSDCTSAPSTQKVSGVFSKADNSDVKNSRASSVFLFERERLPILTFGAILFAK